MKLSRLLVTFAALFLVVASCSVARAASLVLTPLDAFPTEGQPGMPETFRLLYTDQDGDLPESLLMVVETPTGEVKTAPSSTVGTDPAQGITLTWTFTPANNGTYRYFFTAESRTGSQVQFPPADAPDLQFTSLSMVTRIGIFVAGLFAALVLLPFIVYAVFRAAHRRGDPSASARLGLLVGVLASYALYWGLFAGVYHTLGLVIAAVAAVAVVLGILTRR